jgi:NAD(P)-dependent dehydrogenase (short-subunit alcohol dehydrogenase family)
VGRYGKDGVNTWDYSAKRVTDSVYESMERLNIEYIDLINVHDIEFQASLPGGLQKVAEETLPALVELKKKGVVGHIGITDLQPENIKDTLHAYQMAKRCNEKRVMAECVKWGKRGARLNDIAPGIIVTPLAIDEFNGPRGDFYKNMFAKCPAGRPGTADEVANVAELLMSDKAAFITGSTFLCDGGATSSFFYGDLRPTE